MFALDFHRNHINVNSFHTALNFCIKAKLQQFKWHHHKFICDLIKNEEKNYKKNLQKYMTES